MTSAVPTLGCLSVALEDCMKRSWLTVVAALALAGAATVLADGQDKPKVQVAIPDPGVPEALSIEGKFVRAAYNNEAYAIIGYQVSNRSIDEEWMMLDLGTTMRDGQPEYTFKREHLTLDTPTAKGIKLASVEDYRKANLRALENRARVQRDSINYFPPMATQACRIGFFAELGSPALAWDQVEVSNRRACVGRIFFQIPGGIKHGQYFLNVKFEKTLIRVPFRILTEEEEKFLGKNYKAIDKQIDEIFRPKKK
jgi:hypothetical protein